MATGHVHGWCTDGNRPSPVGQTPGRRRPSDGSPFGVTVDGPRRVAGRGERRGHPPVDGAVLDRLEAEPLHHAALPVASTLRDVGGEAGVRAPLSPPPSLRSGGPTADAPIPSPDERTPTPAGAQVLEVPDVRLFSSCHPGTTLLLVW